MNKTQVSSLIEQLEESCSRESRARFVNIIDHLKAMKDDELYPVVMTILAYAFKRNHRLMANLLMLGYKLIDESQKGDHKLVVENFYANFAQLFKEERVQ